MMVQSLYVAFSKSLNGPNYAESIKRNKL